MRKKLLILGAGNAQIDLIEYARDAGLEIYGCSYTNTDKGIPLLDHFAMIDITDAGKIEKYVVENRIDYIYSVGSDVAVPTICKVAEKTGKFHFVSSRTAQLCCNKHLMREAFGQDSRFQVPYMVCKTLAETEKASFYPMVIKPVDSQGQRGVYRVNTFTEVSEHFDSAMGFSKSGQIILEKYISGREVSVNAYIKDGEVIFSMLSDRESFPDLPGGIIKAHHLPSVFENTKTHTYIKELVAEAVKKLEIGNGPVYFQIKVSDGHPYLIEVTPRLDGCHMWRLIKEYCGVNLLEMTMSHMLGKDIRTKKYDVSSIPFHTEFFCEPPETVFQAEKYENRTGVYKRMYYETGDTVKRMNGYMEKCGYRIFMSPKKIGLVGGSGFIGRTFKKLFGDQAELKDVSRQNCIVSQYSADQLEQALAGCDSVVILAAKKANPKETQSLALYEENVRIVENTLVACNKLGIKNIVYLSSRCVYAAGQKVPVAEDGEICPINYYGISKYTGELLCGYYNRIEQTNIKILRLSQVVGNDKNGYMIDRFMENAEKGLPLTVYGKSVGQRDYIYVKDACRAIWAALHRYDLCGVYNIGSGVGTTNLELAKAVTGGFHSSSQVEMLTEKQEDTSISYLDVSKAKEELGFSCEYSLQEAFCDLKKERG